MFTAHTNIAGCAITLTESGTYVIRIPVAEPYVLLFIHQKCLNFRQNILEEKKNITNKCKISKIFILRKIAKVFA